MADIEPGTLIQERAPQLCTLVPLGANGLPLSVEEFGEAFVADVTTSEVHTRASTIASVPVEKGSNITDSRKRGSQVITLSAIITEIPPDAAYDFRGFPADFRARDVQTKASPDRPQAVLNNLLSFDSDDRVLELVTAMARYKRVMIESISFKREAEKGNAILVDLVLKEIRMASVSTAELKAPVTKVASAKKKKNVGNKPAATAKKRDASAAELLVGPQVGAGLQSVDAFVGGDLAGRTGDGLQSVGGFAP